MQKRLVFASFFTVFVCYSVFVYTSGTQGSNITIDERARAGKMLFQKHNCAACHQFYGLGGFLGPELTTTMSQPARGASYARAFLKTGTQRMPNFHLTEDEMDELIAYFEYVDATAITYKEK